ncbi:hypothetical protein [Streptomyces sp. WAC 01529]|uniref:hypothetical protein n=1 Tax=Streptomyces sp. WAC 01529 TaxID=2203205 RepID=UPI0019CF5358|nr:hypothetical protein [Streptomyces sp. WAC 01529]
MHGTTARGVPAWARRVAVLTPFTVLPSGIWRIAEVTLGLPLTKNVDSGDGDLPGWLPAEFYVVALSLVAETLGFLAVGLVATWGEVWPRWVPFLRGRPVRPMAAIVPAALGALALSYLWPSVVIRSLAEDGWRATLLHDVGTLDWRAAVYAASYLPLVAWGPMLAALTYAYAVRRGVVGGRRARLPRPAPEGNRTRRP